MKIKTTRFGEIEVPKENVISMPRGMIGMPQNKTFTILQHKKDSPLLWYQSLEDPELAFVITNPYLFVPDYQIDLKAIMKDLPWNAGPDTNGHHLMLYVVVNIPPLAPQDMTANLIGPLVVEHQTRLAAQAVISDSGYSHRHRLMNKAAA